MAPEVKEFVSIVAVGYRVEGCNETQCFWTQASASKVPICSSDMEVLLHMLWGPCDGGVVEPGEGG